MIEIDNLEKRLEEDGFVVSNIKGISMLPFIKQNKDNVIITKVDKPIEIYDTVLYITNENYILHRVIDINGDELIIKGDNTINSEKVNIKQVLGILKAKYNKNGYVEINSDINKKYYELSNKHLLIKRVRNHFLRKYN